MDEAFPPSLREGRAPGTTSESRGIGCLTGVVARTSTRHRAGRFSVLVLVVGLFERE